MGWRLLAGFFFPFSDSFDQPWWVELWCDIGIGIAILEKIILPYPDLTTLPPTAIVMEPKALDPILQMDRLVFRQLDFAGTEKRSMWDTAFFKSGPPGIVRQKKKNTIPKYLSPRDNGLVLSPRQQVGNYTV